MVMDKLRNNKFIVFILGIALLLILCLGFFSRTYLSKPNAKKSSVQQSSSKTFQNNIVRFSYPADWSIRNSSSSKDTTIIYFQSESKKREQGHGLYMLVINRGNLEFTGTPGLVSTQPYTWLGKPARLQVYETEVRFLVVTTNDDQYQLSMETPSFYISPSDTALFKTIANSFMLK
jgi:hypothetical protein